jgi:hypothetical protein
MMIRLGTRDRVDCSATIRLNLPAASVWGQLRDFRRYASQEYFHRDIRVAGGVVRQGARLRMLHAFAGISAERTGRILRWREGEGFTFSDLSLKGPHSGFPHVLSLRIESVDADVSVVHVCVRGRWTARWIPAFARRIWLFWVFAYVVARTRNELLGYQAAKARRATEQARFDSAGASRGAGGLLHFRSK